MEKDEKPLSHPSGPTAAASLQASGLSMDEDELVLVGSQCKRFRDDLTAHRVHLESHLVNWHGREDLTMDRFRRFNFCV